MSEEYERLEAMIEPEQQTWDLSPNDVAAIKWAITELTTLRRQLAMETAALLARVGREKTPGQRQDSVTDQLRDLHQLAILHGMYDAADWIKRRFEQVPHFPRAAGSARRRSST